MANNRYINTNFWRDTYVIDLDPIEKLLFLYLLTNPNTNIAGIYEISLRQIAFDTGIDKEMVAKILMRFQKDGKMYYNKGWLALNNWIKHQALNPKISAGVGRIIENLPDWLKKDLLSEELQQSSLLDEPELEPIHRLSKPIALNLIKYNLIKYNSTADKPAEDLNKASKISYAKAVRADEALEKKESDARTRPASEGKGYKKAVAMKDAIKQRNMK